MKLPEEAVAQKRGPRNPASTPEVAPNFCAQHHVWFVFPASAFLLTARLSSFFFLLSFCGCVSVGVFAWADSWLWPFWGRRKWGFGLVACQLSVGF